MQTASRLAATACRFARWHAKEDRRLRFLMAMSMLRPSIVHAVEGFRFAPESTIAIHISVPSSLARFAGGLDGVFGVGDCDMHDFQFLGCFSLPWMRPHRHLKQALASTRNPVIEKERAVQRLGARPHRKSRSTFSDMLFVLAPIASMAGCSGIRRA